MIDIEETKLCPDCGDDLPLGVFGRNAQRSSGINAYCRPCANERSKEISIRLRVEVLRHYGGKCACCGEDRYEFLSLDHIQGGGGKHIRSIGSQLARWVKSNGFPQGFRVLCHSCNFSIGHYGYCPHQVGTKVSMEEPKPFTRSKPRVSSTGQIIRPLSLMRALATGVRCETEGVV